MRNKIIKKSVCIIITLLMIISTMALTGCDKGEDGYPIQLGHTVLETSPKSVTVLDANLADIIINLGYATRLVGKSDTCNQELIEIIPTMGNAQTPDVKAITAANTDVVIANEDLGAYYIEQLKSNGIKVFRLPTPQSDTELQNLYITIAKIFSGTNGEPIATQTYQAFYTELVSTATGVLGTNQTYNIAYIYIDSDGNLASPVTGSFANKILSTTGSNVITADDKHNATGDNLINLLANYNPAFIFYDSQDALDRLRSNSLTAKLYAIEHNQCYQFGYDKLNLMGVSASTNSLELLVTMYPELQVKVEPEGEQTTEVTATDIEKKYGITITEGMVIDANSDIVQIFALQQRLADLGYYKYDVDGKFGQGTERAITDFQYINNFSTDGIADFALLEVLFSNEAIPLSSQ